MKLQSCLLLVVVPCKVEIVLFIPVEIYSKAFCVNGCVTEDDALELHCFAT